jgi:hypothetical protein
VGFDVLTTCQPSTVWCSRERLPAAAAQPAKVRQSCSATDDFYFLNTPIFRKNMGWRVGWLVRSFGKETRLPLQLDAGV